MAEEYEQKTCDLSEFRRDICSRGRKFVVFIGKEFAGTEPFLQTLGKAYEDGYFGNVEVSVYPVDSEECDRLAEAEHVDNIPTVNVYEACKKIGSVTPKDNDPGFQKTIEKLIDLSED